MNKFCVQTAIFLLVTATLTQAQNFEFDGNFSQEAVSSNGELLAISSTLSTTIFKVVSTQAVLEKVTKLTLKIKSNKGQDITGYPLSSVISNEGLFIANLNGQLLQAWKIDTNVQAASLVWSINTKNVYYKNLILLDGGVFLASHYKGLNILSLEDGSLVQSKTLVGLKKAIKLQDGSLAILVGESLITISKDTFSQNQTPNFADKIGQIFSPEFNNSRKFRGIRNIFSLKNLKWGKSTKNGQNPNQKGDNFVLILRKGRGNFASIVKTNSLEVVNSFSSPHSIFEINSVEVISGTDLIITSGGNNSINFIKAFENQYGYPKIVKQVRYNHPVLRAVHIPNTTAFLASFYKKYKDSQRNLVIGHFCAFKYCEKCENLNSCQACAKGLDWNEETRKCIPSVF